MKISLLGGEWDSWWKVKVYGAIERVGKGFEWE